MASKKEVTVSREVYSKIALHLTKYYYTPVLGYLIGSGNQTVNVVDIVPICHSVPAGPILELCGEVADKLCTGSNKVVGVYFSSESPNTNRPVFLERVLANLRAITGDAVLLTVNHDLIADNSKLFLEGSTVEGQRLDCKVSGSSAQEVNGQVNVLLKTNTVQLFADFEDHMNSSGAADFTNKHLAL